MTDSFSYSNSFVLDKAHFQECFAQSISQTPTFKSYFKAIVLAVFGALLVLFTEVNPYAAWFVFSLGILEALSIYYRKAWWVTRQMLSKASNSEVTLLLDESGIQISSFYRKMMLRWESISSITATEKGWLIVEQGVKHYLSNSCLNAEAQQFIHNKSENL